MQIKRLWSASLVLVTALSLVAGCGAAKPGQPVKPQESAAPAPGHGTPGVTNYPIELTDAAGRTVVLKAEPMRILSLAPSNTELLWALGKGDLQVGRTDFCDFPEDVKKIASVGGIVTPNYEKILSVKPDLVLMTSGSVPVRDKLTKEYGLTVLVVDPKDLNQMAAGVKSLGIAVNAQPAAETLLRQIDKTVKEVEATVAKATSKPKVFYELWHDPLMTAGKNTFVNDMIRVAGGQNVGAEVDGWAEFSLEKLQAANPELIIAGSQDAAAKIKERKGWEGFKAVKEGKVIPVADQNLIVRPGPRLIEGLKWMARTIHPELTYK